MTPYASQNARGAMHSSALSPSARINTSTRVNAGGTNGGTAPAGPANGRISESSASKNSQTPALDQAFEKAGNEVKLSEAELKIVESLKKTDRAVRQHEMAHIAAGGQYITSGARLEYKKGPDGQRYAVAGEVSIDTSPVPGDPAATAEKMRKVQQAALAPASPSSTDRAVASKASALAVKAASEMMAKQAEQQAAAGENKALGNHKAAAGTYAKVQNPDPETGMTLNTAA
ncbi:MAG TPA: putative metalloprotease CJM1_0395 family protein [Desulfobacteraceae bacterium]|nr:putative metalloprotease CJM1_0395 family protein [Desulfobacteraceae bacterium]